MVDENQRIVDVDLRVVPADGRAAAGIEIDEGQTALGRRVDEVQTAPVARR